MSFVSSPHPPASPPGRRHGWHFRPPGNALCKEEIAPWKTPRDSWSTGLCDPPCVYTKRQKKRSQYPAILTEQAWSRIYYMAKKRTSLAGPSREIRRGRILPAWVTNQKVVCEQALHLGDIVTSTRASGTQGETRPKRNIRFILPTRRLSHIMKHQTGCAEALVQDA